LVASVALVISGCTGDPNPCEKASYDSTLVVAVDTSLSAGELATDGACSKPACATPVDAGCVEWHADLTGGTDTACTVTFSPGGGSQSVTAVVHEETSCHQIVGGHVSFLDDGGVIVRVP
jgi:hypothetical protein